MKFSKEELSQEVKLSKGGLIFFGAYIVALIFLFSNLPETISLISKALTVISPFITGFVFAFLLNIPMNFFEKKVFGFMEKKNNAVWNKVKRLVSFVISIAIIVLVLMFFATFIYNEIYKSISEFTGKLPEYMQHIQDGIGGISKTLTEMGVMEEINSYISSMDFNKIGTEVGQTLSKASPDILNGVANVFEGVKNATVGIVLAVFNLVMSLIFAIYLLFGKERILRQIRKTMYAYIEKERVEKLRGVAALTNEIFVKFTVGQLMEMIILGTLYFIATSLADMPYPALIAVLMAIGGIIPVIGPIVTAVPSALIVFMVGGWEQALWFIVMAVIIQQVESNIIYPKVIGESVGLPGVWVLLAVLAGEKVGGMLGMIVAVPAASVLYKLLKQDVDKRVKKRVKAGEIAEDDYNKGGAV